MPIAFLETWKVNKWWWYNVRCSMSNPCTPIFSYKWGGVSFDCKVSSLFSAYNTIFNTKISIILELFRSQNLKNIYFLHSWPKKKVLGGWATGQITPELMSGQCHCQLCDSDKGTWSKKTSGPFFVRSSEISG